MATEDQTLTLAPPPQISNLISTLESEQTLIASLTSQYRSLTSHLSSLSQTLASRSSHLTSRLQSLSSSLSDTLDDLDVREGQIPDQEFLTAASIETKKQSAIADLENPGPREFSSKGEILRCYCRRMDSRGLWKFMVSQKKDLGVLRKAIGEAIGEAVDECRLVIDAIDDFLKESGGNEQRWVVGMLVRGLFDVEGRKGPEVSNGIREGAGKVAEEWRRRNEGKGKGKEGDGMGGGEAQIFVQMVAAFGLGGRFDGEELKRLVVEHAGRKEMAKLAAGLGFGEEKMTGILDLFCF